MKIAATLFLALSVGFAAPAVAGGKQAWVVNGVGNSVQVIDTDLATVVTTIPLPLAGGAPGAIAFSTVDGHQGAFAFVSQGRFLHVLNATTRSVTATFDLSALSGDSVSVAALDAAQNRELAANPAPSIEAYLLAAADVIPSGGMIAEPYYLVLDQKALIGQVPGNPLVESGPLISATVPPANRGVATGVSVLGAPHGPAFIRAWFSTHDGASPVTLRSALLTKDSQLNSSWSVDRTVETPLAVGIAAPAAGAVAVPHDREMPLLPTGRAGLLINLETAGRCDLGGDLRQVAIAGPGLGGYQVAIIDGLTEEIHLVNGATCGIESFGVGSNPVALTVNDDSEHGEVIVANQNSDDVSILRLDGTVVQVPLGQGKPQTCQLCPVAIATRKCCSGCSVKDLSVTTTGGGDDELNWTKVGCTGCPVSIYCQCAEPDDTDCPCYCDPDAPVGVGNPPCFANLPPGVGSFLAESDPPFGTGPDSETPWIHLGQSLTSDFTHEDAGAGTLEYAVAPDEP